MSDVVPSKQRRSDRVTAQLPLVISGVDILGETFSEPAQTIVVARYGAKILSRRKLAPQLEISVHSLMTNEDADARVVGCVLEDAKGTQYGIELLDPEMNPWGVEFPPHDPNDSALGRLLLECVRCKRREIVKLNELHAEVLERSHSLWRECRRCAEPSLWKEAWLKPHEDLPEEEEAPAAKPEPPRRTRDDRRYSRLEIQMEALIRDPQSWEEVVKTQDVSRGGFRFKSRKHYALDWRVEVALPRSSGGANIFSAAKIKFVGEVPGEEERTYGVAYTPWEDAWADRWT
ncbi:MAG: PilZ domain-containing protein [Acidobacteria bacterium]|nr:PilZ domain-containing protein [Acidobacteriota bacterium]